MSSRVKIVADHDRPTCDKFFSAAQFMEAQLATDATGTAEFKDVLFRLYAIKVKCREIHWGKYFEMVSVS